ncbi:MAG: hypothetical protein ACJA1C_002294 [Crocinitomicaceae bacterium]|jgi:hypothetical protein
MNATRHLLFFALLFFAINQATACTFDGNETSAGTISPTAAYQTATGVSSGNYFTINAVCGTTYNFTFCSNGGSATWDTQITVLNAAGNTQLAYNDDNCGLQSNISYTANASGPIQVLISQYSCNNLGSSTGATLAYNGIAGASNPAFTITSTGCTTASSTITGDTGGTFSFNPAPGDAAVINPTTGAITSGTAGATYTVQYTVSCGVNSTQNVTLDATGSAAFSMSVTCGGGTAAVTGAPGGTFAFNPAPGDGSQVNATTGTVTNGTVGTTYFVEYTVCGNSSIESVTVLTDNCWTLNGNAQWITVGGEDCIQMTQPLNNQLSCAWSGSQIDFAGDFTLTLDYYFGSNNGAGADGNTFTFQPSASTACGTAGGQLGAGGIPNALVIEFDTYDNDNPTHLYDMSCDHIAVEIDGSMQFAAPLCGPVCAKPGGGNIDDGGTYTVDIQWTNATNTLEVYFDGVLRLTCVNDFITNAFGGTSQVYWGATSATGGLNNEQYFCPSSIIIVMPVELSSFETECLGEEELISWTTVSENNSDYFELEYTYDGFVYWHVETVAASGNSEAELNYNVRVQNNDNKQRYYRLKMVDTDGTFEYTDLLSSKHCLGNTNLISNAIQTESAIIVSTSEETNVKFVNQLGQVVFQGWTDDQYLTLDKSGIGSGVYYIICETQEGIQELRKMFVAH